MIYKIVVTQFTKMLENFSAVLAKGAQFADEKKFDASVLCNSRLAPDQFNFIRQVQIMCDTAKVCAGSLANKEKDIPVHPDEEATIPELKKRIASVVAYLNSFSPKDFTGAEERKVSRPRWEGKYMSGEEFLLQHAVPNFYFHFTTAYAILRHNGVNIGKKDFLGDMPYKA